MAAQSKATSIEPELKPTSLRDHVVRLYDLVESLTGTIDKGLTDSRRRVDDLSNKFEEFIDESQKSRRTNWPVILTIGIAAMGLLGGFIVTALGCFWFVMSMKMDSTMNPIRAGVASLKSNQEVLLTTVNTNLVPRVSDMFGDTQKGLTERRDIKDRMDRKEALDQVRDLKITALIAGNVERESQFHFEDELRNSEYAQVQRDLTTVLNMAQGKMERATEPYYFPSQSRRGDEEIRHVQ